MKIILLLCVLVALSGAISRKQKKQLNGLRDLLTNLPNDVFATCNIAFFSTVVDFNTAQENCRNFDIGAGAVKGNLVTINTDEKNEDLKMLLEMTYPEDQQPKSKWANTKWVWSGLRKVDNVVGSPYQEVVYLNDDWQWANGSTPGDFAKWAPKQPDQNALKYRKNGCNEKPKCYQNQMRINHEGEWDDTYKFMEHPYACDYQGKYVISSNQVSWEHAKLACDNAGLHLAKIRSGVELNEMMTAMDYFLGEKDETLKKWDPNNWMWLGGNDINEEKQWVWEADGEKIEWDIPWMKKAGNDNSERKMKEGQDVMALSRWGKVDDSYRLGVYRPFACQCPDT